VHLVWGAELSPFVLKLEALLRAAAVPFRRLPRDGSRGENLRAMLRVERAKRRRTVVRYPDSSPLDEYPLVPFLITPDGTVMYDSSALAAWLDDRQPDAGGRFLPLDPGARLACRLIDEAFDEFGLYMVHHNRWKLAACENDRPGLRLAREYARHFPPGTGAFAGRWFERRQVSRLPYLFSVAPAGYGEPGLAAALTPPARAGFPPTHALLESAWERYLAACEGILRAQPFLLGERFTLADASTYGQLSMNLTDPAAARRLRDLAPRTYDWLCEIRDQRGAPTGTNGSTITGALGPLLDVILETFIPLMRQNEAAYETAVRAGVSLFNERAFDRGSSLYDGELLGHPFRAVIKTFQVRVWRDLRADWQALDRDTRGRIAALTSHGDLDALFRSVSV
jgi:glutathione S-transferase